MLVFDSCYLYSVWFCSLASQRVSMPKRKLDGSSSAKRGRRQSRNHFCFEDDFAELAAIEVDTQAALNKPDLPPGPSSPAQLSQWPVEILELALRSDDRRNVYLKNVQFGSLHSTDYSGFDSPRETVSQLHAATTHGLLACPPPRFVRSCDCAKLPLKCLLWAAENLDHGKSCVLDNIESALSPETLATLDKMIPHKLRKQLSKDQKKEVEQGYLDMWDYLIAHRDEICPDPLLSDCLACDDRCPVSVKRDRLDSDHILRLNWAGTSCVGWTSVGKQDRFCHASERVHNIWLLQRVVLEERDREDGFFQDI